MMQLPETSSFGEPITFALRYNERGLSQDAIVERRWAMREREEDETNKIRRIAWRFKVVRRRIRW